MTPEALKRAHDWIEVREELLARVSSLDPKRDANDRNIRPMYAHLLSALRRATITLIRVISEGHHFSEEDSAAAREGAQGCFMWRGTNYLAKIWYGTVQLHEMPRTSEEPFFRLGTVDCIFVVYFIRLD